MGRNVRREEGGSRVTLRTGLGLSIAYGNVKEHHADIRVESDVGRGTEFRVPLPLSVIE